MATQAQKEAARKNVEKAREAWKGMSAEERAGRRPEGKERRGPGEGGGGDYYHVAVRDDSGFKTFRTHDVGDSGRVQRVAGQRKSGSWDTVKWLIPKDEAHVENGYLQGDTADVRKVLDRLGSKPRHQEGDRFKAEPRPDLPEEEKPTEAQKRARQENIQKAQEARH